MGDDAVSCAESRTRTGPGRAVSVRISAVGWGGRRRAQGGSAAWVVVRMAAVKALPDDDPQALEIVCRAVVGRVYVGTSGDWRRDQEDLWRRAATIDARRPVLERRARYASLMRGTVRLKSGFYQADPDALFVGPVNGV